MNVIELFERAATRFADRTFLIDADGKATFHQVDERSNVVAADLAAAGVAPGDTVAVCAPDSIDVWVGIIGIWKAGALPGMLDAGTSDDVLDYFVDDIGAKTCIAAADQHERLRAHGVGAIVDVAGIGGSGSATGPHVHTDDSEIFLSYTSGSTGKPKGAVLVSEPVTVGTSCIAERLGLSSDDVLLATTPVASSFQLVAAILPAFHRGSTVVLAAGRRSGELLELCKRHRATVLVAYPLTLADFVHEPGSDDSVATLRAALSGGSTLPPRLKHEYRNRLGVPLLESYGQSELGGFMAMGAPADDDRVLDGFVGRSLPDRVAYVGDDDGAECPPGVPGEVLVTERYFSYYRNKPDKTAEATAGGRLHTGDVGVADLDGCIKVLGRTAEADAAAERGFWLRELEDAAYGHPGVKHACAVQSADGGVRCFVEPLPGVEVSAEAVADWVAANHRSFDAEYLVLDAMPRTFSGKADRMGLADRHRL